MFNYAVSKFGDNFAPCIPKLPQLRIKKVTQSRTITFTRRVDVNDSTNGLELDRFRLQNNRDSYYLVNFSTISSNRLLFNK